MKYSNFARQLSGKKVWIIGLGKSGWACAKILNNCGCHLILSDGKAQHEHDALMVASFDSLKHRFIFNDELTSSPDGVEMVVLSPGVIPSLSVFRELRELAIPIIGEVELAFRLVEKIDIIGITGTNGKTTTTALLGEICKRAGYETYVVGNIGQPIISAINEASDDAIFVTELSSFQLETCQLFRPKIGAVINLTPDHLDRHGDMKNYARVKSQIFTNQTSDDFAVLNHDDSLVASMNDSNRGRTIFISMKGKLSGGVYYEDAKVISDIGNQPIEIIHRNEIQLPGLHNIENILIATACALAYGINQQIIREVLSTFSGVAHRLQKIGVINDVCFINDSKGTNTDAAIKALDAYDCQIVLIAGGKGKGASYLQFAEKIKEKVAQVILIGQDADKIAEQLLLCEYFRATKAVSMAEAVRIAFELAVPGGIVLLSPACASFDMFNNFEERGEVFANCVRKLSIEKIEL